MAFLPWMAEAAGLGRLTVISGLGEPLNAEIELISTSPEELASLTASIASEEAYATQGIERTGLHSAIKVDVEKRPSGNPVLKLSTRQPVSDPFLDMLIQVDWATGRLLREYTVLLDPPGYNAEATPDTTNAPTVQSTAPIPARTTEEPATDSVNPGAQATEAATPSDAVQERETARGDTLNSLAREMQVEGVSLEQMLVGLYRANKNAFVGNNMNRLKVGEIIRAPSYEELQAVGRREAAQEIRVHTEDWNAYRNRLAGIVAESEAANEDVSNQSTSGSISAPAEDRAATSDNASQDVVRLSKSDTSPNAASNQNLQDKLNALQEEVIARENSLKEANDRTAALEKQIQDMQELLAIKNQALANVQQGAAEENANAATQQPGTTTPAAPVIEQPPATTDSAAAPATSPTTPTAPIKPQAAPAKKAVVAPAPAAESTSFLDDLLQNQLLLAIAGGALVLLGGAWLLLRNKRRRELDTFEKGILTSGGLKANTVFGNTSGDTVDTGDTSFLTDFSQSTGGLIDTHDVDPIAEAEVYMAYGRDAQAEEILKDAIAKDPKRYELHLKLLEIFAARNDVASFETIAGELYSTLGAADPTWIKVAEIGRKLEPDNPLYTTAAAGTVAAAIAASSAGLASTQPAPANINLESDLADAERIGAADLDFSLGNDHTAEPASFVTTTQQDGLIDLNQKTLPVGDSEETLPGLDLAQTVTVMSEPETELKDEDIKTAYSAQPLAADTVQLDVGDFAPTVADNELPSFDGPDLILDTPAEKTQPEEFAEPMEISFDLPEASAEPEKPASNLEGMPSLEFIGFDEVKSDHAAQDESINFEPVTPATEEITLSFDLNDEPAEAAEPSAAPKLPEMDLSSISLDLNDSGADNNELDKTALSAESTEVNTKLDLVGAYIDMDDIEGAKELLEEVLKEGGPNQRQHAQKLLSSLA